MIRLLAHSLIQFRVKPLGDVLSTSSKVAGGYVYVTKERKDGKRCIPIQKTFRSSAVDEYLNSDQFFASNFGDYALYSAVNRSLDLTIERIGQERFQDALQAFRTAQKLVREQCDQQAHFPCSFNGTHQFDLSKRNCYHHDEGALISYVMNTVGSSMA